ncbi:MAG: linear amide C-N hydrolase [Aliidongia sp.]
MCLDFLIGAADGSFINGRSMEFAVDLQSRPFIRKRGAEMSSTAPHDQDGLRWTTRYGYLGMNAYDRPLVVDGLNEKGLSAGVLWLPGSIYQTVTEPARALSVSLFADWMLGNFADTDEVRRSLSSVQVWADAFTEKKLMPVHFSVHDATGKSIVIEFTEGEAILYDNPIACLTNAPVFPWHLENIRSYVGLTPWDVGSTEIDGTAYAQTGHGSGLRGLPGDFTPPSRLIRTLFLKQYANQAADAKSGRNLALHLLNDTDIAKGVIREKTLFGQQDDHTQWAVVKDLTNLVYYYRTYDDLMLRRIDLRRIDFGSVSGGELDVPAGQDAIDVTPAA